METAFPSWSSIPILGVMPIFEFSLIVLFVAGAIYWFGFKRRRLLASGETGESALAD